MPTLSIGNHDVEVDDGFLKLSPDEQNATVDHIANSLKQSGVDLGGHTSMADVPELPQDRASGLGGRAAVQAAPGAVLGLPAMAYDAVANLPRYLTKQAYNAVARPMGWQETPLNDPLATTHALGQLGEMGADAMGLPKPETPGERIAVTGGQTALEALGGSGIAKAGSAVTQGATKLALESLAAAPKTQAAIGGLGGAGAQTAAEMGYSPLIGTAIGTLLGAGGAAAASGARAGVQAARDMANRALARGDEVQQALARQKVFNAASDPAAALQNIEEGAGGELVPGSKPTAFQATGDMGLGSFERDLQTANPEVFAQRRADQNSARLGTLQQVQGQGNPQEVVSALRQHLDQIDKATAGQEAGARTAAEAAAEKIQPSDNAAGLGQNLRGDMSEAEKGARAQEKALWKAIDPEGTLAVDTTGAKQATQDIYGGMTTAAKIGLAPIEKEFVGALEGYKPVESFKEFQDLGSQIKQAMREELKNNGQTATYGRLSQLNQAVRSGMEDSAAQRIASDPAAEARFQAYRNEPNTPLTDPSVGEHNLRFGSVSAGGVSGLAGEEAQGGRTASPPASGQGVQSPGVQATAASGQPTFTSQQLNDAIKAVIGEQRPINTLNGRQSQAVFEHLQSAGRQSSAHQTPEALFQPDPGASTRYRAATDATRERATTYNKGYAGDILRKGEMQGTFRMNDASVTANAFRPGPTGGERIKAIVAAGGSPDTLSDMAALSLAQHVKNGVLDPAGFQRWQTKFREALAEIPQEVRAKFANAAQAAQTLEETVAKRKVALDGFNKSVLGAIAGVEPGDLPKQIGAILNARDGTAKMAQLAKAVRGNEAAKEGLRRALAEYIEAKFISNKEVGTSGENGLKADGFSTFVREKAPVLKQVFSGPDLLRMQAIADDIKRAERSLNAVKTPGQSNTAQDVGVVLDKAAEKAGSGSVLSQMMKAGAVGLFAGGPKGAVAGAGGAWAKSYLGAMRAAGMQKVDDLVLEMMLDPHLAKVALMKAPATDNGVMRMFTASLNRISGLSALSADRAIGTQQTQ